MLSASICSALISHRIIDGFTWKDKDLLSKINRLPRMIQKWVMFENVPNTDRIIIVEATLENNQKINPFTGKEAVLDSTDYKLLMKNKSQLWRKYFEWLYTKHIKGHRDARLKNNFKNWILDSNNTYFNKNLNGNKIKDVEIWKISQNSPRIDNKLYKSVTTKSRLEDKPHYGKNKNKLKKAKQKTRIKKIN